MRFASFQGWFLLTTVLDRCSICVGQVTSKSLNTAGEAAVETDNSSGATAITVDTTTAATSSISERQTSDSSMTSEVVYSTGTDNVGAATAARSSEVATSTTIHKIARTLTSNLVDECCISNLPELCDDLKEAGDISGKANISCRNQEPRYIKFLPVGFPNATCRPAIQQEPDSNLCFVGETMTIRNTFSMLSKSLFDIKVPFAGFGSVRLAQHASARIATTRAKGIDFAGRISIGRAARFEISGKRLKIRGSENAMVILEDNSEFITTMTHCIQNRIHEFDKCDLIIHDLSLGANSSVKISYEAPVWMLDTGNRLDLRVRPDTKCDMSIKRKYYSKQLLRRIIEKVIHRTYPHVELDKKCTLSSLSDKVCVCEYDDENCCAQTFYECLDTGRYDKQYRPIYERVMGSCYSEPIGAFKICKEMSCDSCSPKIDIHKNAIICLYATNVDIRKSLNMKGGARLRTHGVKFEVTTVNLEANSSLIISAPIRSLEPDYRFSSVANAESKVVLKESAIMEIYGALNSKVNWISSGKNGKVMIRAPREVEKVEDAPLFEVTGYLEPLELDNVSVYLGPKEKVKIASLDMDGQGEIVLGSRVSNSTGLNFETTAHGLMKSQSSLVAMGDVTLHNFHLETKSKLTLGNNLPSGTSKFRFVSKNKVHLRKNSEMEANNEIICSIDRAEIGEGAKLQIEGPHAPVSHPGNFKVSGLLTLKRKTQVKFLIGSNMKVAFAQAIVEPNTKCIVNATSESFNWGMVKITDGGDGICTATEYTTTTTTTTTTTRRPFVWPKRAKTTRGWHKPRPVQENKGNRGVALYVSLDVIGGAVVLGIVIYLIVRNQRQRHIAATTPASPVQPMAMQPVDPYNQPMQMQMQPMYGQPVQQFVQPQFYPIMQPVVMQ